MHKSSRIGVCFYLLALGGHASYAFQGESTPVTFVILMTGLLVFFTADWLYNKNIHKKKPSDESFFLF